MCATPLYIASSNGHVDAARLLLDKGAEVDRARKDGATPLYAACQEGHVARGHSLAVGRSVGPRVGGVN